MTVLTILPPVRRELTATIDLPLSKSMSNRLLVMDFLSGAPDKGRVRSTAGDTLLLQKLLRLIAGASSNTGETVLDAGDAGTVMRFLTALLALTPGKWLLTGSGRLCQRPVGHLVAALESLGAGITYSGQTGYLPLHITGGLLTGSEAEVDGTETSQFASALLLIAPLLPHGLRLTVTGLPASRPYLELTLQMMRQAGILFEAKGPTIIVQPGRYLPDAITEEPDWSAAAFWYEIAALSDGADLLLSGLRFPSLQGDSATGKIFLSLGVETYETAEGIVVRKAASHTTDKCRAHGEPTIDFLDIPDLALPVITTYAALGLPGHFSGLRNLRIKESDRATVLARELSAMGAQICIEEEGDRFRLEPAPDLPLKDFAGNRLFQTYGDHRMAMALAPLALRTGVIRINEPEVVSKSYPGFWEELKKTGFRLH